MSLHKMFRFSVKAFFSVSLFLHQTFMALANTADISGQEVTQDPRTVVSLHQAIFCDTFLLHLQINTTIVNS